MILGTYISIKSVKMNIFTKISEGGCCISPGLANGLPSATRLRNGIRYGHPLWFKQYDWVHIKINFCALFSLPILIREMRIVIIESGFTLIEIAAQQRKPWDLRYISPREIELYDLPIFRWTNARYFADIFKRIFLNEKFRFFLLIYHWSLFLNV